MHKSFMIDYSAYEKKFSSFSDLNLSGKKTLYIFTALFLTLLMFKHHWQNISHL